MRVRFLLGAQSMHVDKIYLGSWFQRTSIHLRELFRFFKTGRGIAALQPEKLQEYWNRLNPQDFEFHSEAEFDYILGTCQGITISVTEDGIILLHLPVTQKALGEEVQRLEQFVTTSLSPAISYLFSSGAPLPKELSRVEELYPIFVVASGGSQGDVQALFQRLQDTPLEIIHREGVSLISGNRFSLLMIKKGKGQELLIEELIRYFVFFREFSEQLNRYLDLHRVMWDTISHIREAKRIRYRNFTLVRYQILEFLKTLSFVEARLAQMHDILRGRNSTTAAEIRAILSSLGLNRFDHLGSDWRYIDHLWKMTTDYARSTLKLLESLYQENTQRELSALKYITFITAVTGFFGMNIAFPWEQRWEVSRISTLVVILLILTVAVAFHFLLRAVIYNRYFSIRR